MISNDPQTARFLRKGNDRHIAIDRLRANQTGTNTRRWDWKQVRECLVDPKTWGWSLMYLLAALPSGGLAAFGPLITRGMGYDAYETTLLQMPSGLIAIILLWSATWVTNRWRMRFAVVAGLTLLPIGGALGLLFIPRDRAAPLLVCFYVAMTFGVLNPLLLRCASLPLLLDTGS
jgi:cyanate permease